MFATDSVENGLDRNPSTLVSLGDNALLDGDLLDDELRLVALDVRPYREALRQSFGEELAGDEMSDAEIREMVFCAWDTLRASFEGGLGIDAAVRRLSMWARVEEAINASDPLKTTLCAFGIHAFICAWWAVSRLVHNPF
ncbi:hypothetical protein GNI_191060 [Gregarina niphandrodes]|uniref:Uncharacterized protein n=1 Tax=Gregarina niphandrodes TaxID=110365 RepID=A0A023AWG2_GRENI|nr:hypothetical protein GNI_191060 [Gregarina niphandrodes]EZG43059.1 hypothetical protein GNI_191060 [Gregarina niphandrodes]|eukprot:XP_011133667.1 hypothetical protein GNI_191060 [Gregarina niphandrodes]